MVNTSRRQLLALAGAAMLMGPGRAMAATPMGIPAGLQLWTVKDDLARDFDGTLRALKALGYDRVETAGWAGKSAAEFRAGVTGAGLDPISSHYSLGDLMTDTEAKLTFARDVGARFCMASSPHPSRALDPAKPWPVAMAEAMTLADWRSNAEEMNRIGAVAKSVGIQFGYHNHAAEFLDYEGVEPFAEMVRMTDPELVQFELDIGWVAAAGADPVELLTTHKDRISLLHIKDVATAERTPGKIADDLQSVPVGQGTIDWASVFRAAQGGKVQSWFVEQEPPFAHPPLEGLRDSLAYLKALDT